MSRDLDLLPFVVFLIFLIWSIWRGVRPRHKWPSFLRDQQALIESEFRSMNLGSTSAQGCFDGSSSIVVLDTIELVRDAPFGLVPSLHRVCKSSAGEYFLYMKIPGKPPYLSHLSPESAKNALRAHPRILSAEFGDKDQPGSSGA
jgi:hypothetical protein